jgi:hypothetical protein
VLQAKERAQTPYPSIVFTFGLIVESIKEAGGVLVSFANNYHLDKKKWEGVT